MNNNGFISLHRKLREHWIWEDAKLLHRWLDILFEARYAPGKLLIAGKLHVIDIGEFRTSKSKLAERWKCTWKAVNRFLKLLEDDGMIETKTDNYGTTVKVSNYAAYQRFLTPEGIADDTPDDPTSDIADDTPSDTPEDRADDTQKNKEIKGIRKKGNKGIKPLPPAADGAEPSEQENKVGETKAELRTVRNSFTFPAQLQKSVNDWIKYKFEKRQGYKPMGLKNLLTQIQNNADRYGEEAVVHAISESMASNYMGIVWDKAKSFSATDEVTGTAKGNKFFRVAERLGARGGENQ